MIKQAIHKKVTGGDEMRLPATGFCFYWIGFSPVKESGLIYHAFIYSPV